MKNETAQSNFPPEGVAGRFDCLWRICHILRKHGNRKEILMSHYCAAGQSFLQWFFGQSPQKSGDACLYRGVSLNHLPIGNVWFTPGYADESVCELDVEIDLHGPGKDLLHVTDFHAVNQALLEVKALKEDLLTEPVLINTKHSFWHISLRSKISLARGWDGLFVFDPARTELWEVLYETRQLLSLYTDLARHGRLTPGWEQTVRTTGEPQYH